MLTTSDKVKILKAEREEKKDTSWCRGTKIRISADFSLELCKSEESEAASLKFSNQKL